MATERKKWDSTFTLNLYKKIHRLRGWHFEWHHTKNPHAASTWTTVLRKKLQNKKLISSAARCSHKHHRCFNIDTRYPEQKEHLSGVVALLCTTESWKIFKINLDCAHLKSS